MQPVHDRCKVSLYLVLCSLPHQKMRLQLLSPTMWVAYDAALRTGCAWQYLLLCFFDFLWVWELALNLQCFQQNVNCQELFSEATFLLAIFVFFFSTLIISHLLRKAGWLLHSCLPFWVWPCLEDQIEKKKYIYLQNLWICCVSIHTIRNWVISAKSATYN